MDEDLMNRYNRTNLDHDHWDYIDGKRVLVYKMLTWSDNRYTDVSRMQLASYVSIIECIKDKSKAGIHLLQ